MMKTVVATEAAVMAGMTMMAVAVGMTMSAVAVTAEMVMVAAGMTEKAAVATVMTVMAAAVIAMMVVGMIEIACRRGRWPVSSISETRIIWNITLISVGF
jgi:TRAP-type uncharacterized transport system substrate-binding protein